MTSLIDSVKCSVVITLSDGTNIDVSLTSVGEKSDITNYVTSLNINESTALSNQNPVGVVSSNTAKIVLKSNDRSLLPDNELSPYFGKMDNTATLKIQLEDVDGLVDFNTFYVSNWVSNITSSNPNQVTIEATDLLSVINKNDVPASTLIKNVQTKEMFISTLEALNSKLNEKYKIKYDASDIDFSSFPIMEYTNFEADKMSTWFNILSQSTLTNIYYTRGGKLKTDYCLDDSIKESVGTLSDKVNILNAGIDKGGLVGYTGVKVNYILNTVNDMTELTTLKGQVIKPGINLFENIDLGKKVYKIGFISIDTESKVALEIKSIAYGKNNASVTINNPASKDVSCDITLYGQSLKENKLFVKKVKSIDASNEILEVTNTLLPQSYIPAFADGLMSLIGIKSSALSISGFFNPRIQVGDIVYVDVESSINVKGYYKVMELNWKISNIIKCDAKVIKTIAVESK